MQNLKTLSNSQRSRLSEFLANLSVALLVLTALPAVFGIENLSPQTVIAGASVAIWFLYASLQLEVNN